MGKLTYNTRLLFNSDEDNQKLLNVLEAHRSAVNECSEVRYHTLTKNSIVELHAAFYSQFRDRNPDIPSQVVIRAEQECLSSYRSIKSNKHKIHKPMCKKKLSMRLDKRIFSHKKGIYSIISLEKRVKCQPYLYPKLKELMSKYKFCDPLLFAKDNEIWIALTFDIPEILPTETLAVGIDLGCRINAATSEGHLYVDKKFNGDKRKLRYLKRCLQSKGTKSAKRHLKKLRHKERNINKNFIHHLANKIIKDTKADVLTFENLKSLKVKKHKYENKNRISQVPIYQLKQVITYKAALLKEPKTVIEVCPSYTSQIDHQTGKKDGVRQGRRYYSKSGTIYDSDINGAINIGLRSKHPVSQTKHLTYGQAVVNQPIVTIS